MLLTRKDVGAHLACVPILRTQEYNSGGDEPAAVDDEFQSFKIDRMTPGRGLALSGKCVIPLNLEANEAHLALSVRTADEDNDLNDFNGGEVVKLTRARLGRLIDGVWVWSDLALTADGDVENFVLADVDEYDGVIELDMDLSGARRFLRLNGSIQIPENEGEVHLQSAVLIQGGEIIEPAL